MFGFIHPSPPSRKEVATQVARQERKTFSAAELMVDLPDGRVIGPAPADAPIRFSVAYTLRDFLGVLDEHLAFLARRDSRARRLAKWLGPVAIGAGLAALAWAAGPGWVRTAALGAGALSLACVPAMTWLWLGVLATPIFYVKRRRMPACDFRIDANGIERTGARGTFVRRWHDVQSIRRYRHAYLVVFSRGAVPIPFRCMTAEQQQRFRALAAMYA